MDTSKYTAAEIVALLELLPHPEGGFFKETYRSGATPGASKGQTDANGTVIDPPPSDGRGKRNVCTSIYYMLTEEAPIGYWHMNQSTIVHYFQGGAPLTYYLIRPGGEWERHVLGPDLKAGHTLQLIVEGGVWKATVLEGGGEWGLLGEAVAPGFDYMDMKFGTEVEIGQAFPQHLEKARPYIKKE